MYTILFYSAREIISSVRVCQPRALRRISAMVRLLQCFETRNISDIDHSIASWPRERLSSLYKRVLNTHTQ